MATNHLRELGKNIKIRSRTIEVSTNRAGANFPLIESSSDVITPLMPFQFEFYTYTKSPSVYLDLTFLEKFQYRIASR